MSSVKSRKFLKRNKYLLIAYFSIIIVLLVALCMYFFKRNIEKITLKDGSFYQYLSGYKVDYNGTIYLDSNNSITKLTFKDVTIELDSTPIYYQKKQKVIFPESMSIIYPLSTASQYKINQYTQIEYDEPSIYLTDGTLKKNLQNCFIFDGSDLYYFLEEVSITIKDKEYILPPFSYAVVRYNNVIELYNYEKDTYEILPIGTENVFAITKSYKINLSIDALIYNGKERLLIKKIDFLSNLK